MILYLVTNRHRYTVEGFSDTWPVPLRPRLRPRIRAVPYEALDDPRRLPRATFIFSDLDRLNGDTRRRAEEAHRHLTALDEPLPVLNDPSRFQGRVDLLRSLKALGINDHACYRLTERRTPERFPVFLREERGHTGALTPLLHDQGSLDRAIARLYLRRGGLRNLLMVEFCDVADPSGEYRKYGAVIVGARIIPQHVFVSRSWSVKRHELGGAARIREEQEFQRTNPHQDELRRILEASGVSFGRIDYGLQDGRVRVWEVNTNPMLYMPRETRWPERLPNRRWYCEQMTRAFEAIDGGAPAGDGVPGISDIRFPGFWQASRARIAAVPPARATYRGARWLAGRAADGVARLAGRPLITLLERTTWRRSSGRTRRRA